MATRVIDDSKLNAIAVAIQAKDNGGQMTVDEMPARIANIPSGGGTLIPKTITQNGVYNATDDGADGYDVVTVDVPEKNTLDEYFANTLEVANIPSANSISANFFDGKSSLVNVTMPNVTNIGRYAFKDCINLVNVTMPNVTNIGNYAFMLCGNLALTSLPSGIAYIGVDGFYRCTKLALTSLPSGVTEIGNYAFNECISIQYLDFSNFTNIPKLGIKVFTGTTFPFYFRDQQQLDEWAAATNWSTYANRFQIKPSGVI